MFENYSSSVQIGHNCGCHSPSQTTPEQYTPAKITKDELGNITKLQWAPDARFTINLTSDTNISVVEGSQILNRSGLTPDNINGWEGLYAYNIVDTICWQYRNGVWTRLPNIVTSNNNSVVLTFSNDQAKTKISIKNFRGETIFTDTEDGNFVPLTVDDSLAAVLMQGFYNVDIYQISSTSTKLIRRIPISITPTQSQNTSSSNNSNSCHSGKGIVTDNTLTYRNGILSVNTTDNCQPGSVLPVSGNAVVEYAQPKNVWVEADLETYTATMSSIDILNYQMFGGEVACLVEGIYLSPFSVTYDKATFKEVIVENSIITSYILTIDNAGKIIEYKKSESHLNPVTSLENIQQELMQSMSALNEQHTADINRMDASIEAMQAAVEGMKAQVGDLQVTEKIVELYNNYNNINSTLQALDNELDNKLEESDVDIIINESVESKLTPERLQDLVNNAVGDNIKLDGGVVE